MKEKRERGKGMRDGRGREKEEYKKFGGEGEKKDNQNFCILSVNYLEWTSCCIIWYVKTGWVAEYSQLNPLN